MVRSWMGWKALEIGSSRKMAPYSASTAMVAAQRSIFSPGELIHLRTLVSNSQLELRDRSPSEDSRHP